MNAATLLAQPPKVFAAERQRRRYLRDPIAWITEQLGEFAWSKQRVIAQSVCDHRRTAVQSCHESGKALALDTPLPTPTGWTTMGDVQPGDWLLTEEGKPVRVTAISPVETRRCSRVVFRDGSTIIASDDHLWSVLDLCHRRRLVADWRNHWDDTRVKTTAEMAAEATTGGQPRWRIPTSQPLVGSEQWPMDVDPYTFGAWLGDGTTVRAELTVHVNDAAFMCVATGGREMPGRTDNVRLVRFRERVYSDCPSRHLGGQKRIPQAALRASIPERLALLQGLMDTDGNQSVYRAVEIAVCKEKLADDIAELVVSLGWVAFRSSRPAKLYGRTVGTAYRISFTPSVNPFRLPRKADKWASRAEVSTRAQWSARTQRTIMAFEPVPDQPVKCVVVDSPRRLYLAGRGMIPTHNSWTAARIAAWWLTNHPVGDAFVITSAPSFSQVRAILWREIGRAHGKGKLPGRVNQTEWFMVTLDGREELVGFGRKPADMDPTGFQGIHARFVLVIFDEASGIPAPLWDAADSLVANDESRFFAIGNPDDPTSEFAEACKPGSGWNVVQIDAFDTPNFTDEPVPDALRPVLIGQMWVEEKRRKWGETNPLWIAKIRGQFPETTTDGLIPISWVRKAQERALEPGVPNELGVDVGAGGDPGCIAHRRGGHVRILAMLNTPDTMETCGIVLQHLRDTGATDANVDEIGIGRGVVDRAKEQDKPVSGINVGEKANDPERFVNLRAELFWGLRERFEQGDVDLDPEDDDTAAELVALKYKATSRGQIQIESKDEMRRRGLPSPNRADAIMLAFAPGAPDAVGFLSTTTTPAPLAQVPDRHRMSNAIFGRRR